MHITTIGFGKSRTIFGVLISCEALSDLDVGENVPIEIFNISFESTQNKQHYGITIASTDARKKLW